MLNGKFREKKLVYSIYSLYKLDFSKQTLEMQKNIYVESKISFIIF